MEGVFPARVDVVKGLIDNGMGGSLFSNDGGVLVLDQLTVANITSAVSVCRCRGIRTTRMCCTNLLLTAILPSRVLCLLRTKEW